MRGRRARAQAIAAKRSPPVVAVAAALAAPAPPAAAAAAAAAAATGCVILFANTCALRRRLCCRINTCGCGQRALAGALDILALAMALAITALGAVAAAVASQRTHGGALRAAHVALHATALSLAEHATPHAPLAHDATARVEAHAAACRGTPHARAQRQAEAFVARGDSAHAHDAADNVRGRCEVEPAAAPPREQVGQPILLLGRLVQRAERLSGADAR